MLKNWSRIALASVLVLMLGAVAANATTSRVRSLANVGDYISDDSAVNRWYSTLVSFANQVNAEVGDWTSTDLTDSRGLGWNFAAGEDGKYGTYRVSLNEASLSHLGFWAGNPFYQFHAPGEPPFPYPGDLDFPYEETPINRWDVAGAWEFGENLALGVSITESKWSFKDEQSDPHVEADNSWLTLGAGLTWTNNENMVVDVLANFGNAGGQVDTGTGSAATGATTLEWDSGTAFEIGGRMFYDWKDNITLVPVVDFITSEYSQTFTATPPAPIAPPDGVKSTDFLLGVGLNMDVNQDNMLVFAVEYFQREVEYANKDTVSTTNVTGTLNSFPTLRLALESHITSWLTTRVGAAKYINSFKVEENRGNELKGTPGNPYIGMPSFAPGFEWFLGCGFNFAEWTVDLELAEETPFGLGYWLTGYADAWADGSGHGPVGRISAVYNY